MKIRLMVLWFVCLSFLSVAFALQAQDLGPGFTKVKDGIYIYAPDATTTTCSFVVTQQGAYKSVKK
jgi:hypothetical protein